MTLSTNPVPLPMGMFMPFKSMLKVQYLYFFIFAGGLLLMETTRLVVAVTQHVVLMVEWLLLHLVVNGCFKIAFDLSSAVLNLLCIFPLGIQWVGKASLSPVMVQERPKTLAEFQ